jgi:polyhydroxyalkanoate synthesis regulator phasin
MLEEIKKALFSGFGAIFLTREKAEAAIGNLVEDAKITREEAQEFLDELFSIGTRQWSEMEASLSRVIRDTLDNMDIASKKDLHGLKSKVGKLEKRLERIEMQIREDENS